MSYAGDVTCAEAYEELVDNPDARLVDCRTDAEWAFVGLPELPHRPVECIQWRKFPTGETNPNFVEEVLAGGEGPVYFLCRSGALSIAAAEAVTAAGITEAYNILDGFEGPLGPHGRRDFAGWKVEGLPWRHG